MFPRLLPVEPSIHQTITGQVLERLQQLRKCSAKAQRPSKQHVAGSNPAWDPIPFVDRLLCFARPLHPLYRRLHLVRWAPS